MHKKFVFLVLTALITSLSLKAQPSNEDFDVPELSANQFNPSFVKEIKVRLNRENITFAVAASPHIKIEVKSEKGTFTPRYELKNSRLVIEPSKKQSSEDSCTVSVFLPKDFKPSLISVKTENGAVSFSDVRARTVSIETSRGSIDLARTSARKLTVTTTRGEFSASGLDADRTFIRDSRRSVNITGLKSDELTIQTSTGDISATAVSTKKLDVTSNQGSVSLWLENPLSQNSSVWSASGSVTVRLPSQSQGRFIVESKKGSSQNEFSSSKSKIKFSVSSKTGDVSLKKSSQ